jgi:probable rRNA maturation factor
LIMNAVIVSDVDERLPEAFIKNWLKNASQHLIEKKLISPEQKALEVSLVFLKEGEAKRLNWKYRGKDYPTDILSFENEDHESLGELVFCWNVLQRQAKEHKLPLEQELGYLMIHGLLHLLGHDHEVPGPQAEKMLGLQDEIFEQMVTQSKKKQSVQKKVGIKADTSKKVSSTKLSVKKVSTKKLKKSGSSVKSPSKPALKAVKTKKR